MRSISLWSLGLCTFYAALATAEVPRSDRAPDNRSLLPSKGKQSANVLTPRAGYRSFSEAADVRSLLPEPSVRRISESEGGKYETAGQDIRSLGRDVHPSAPLHNTAFTRPVEGEKVNGIPASSEVHHLSAPSAARTFRPASRPVKEGYRDRLSERH